MRQILNRRSLCVGAGLTLVAAAVIAASTTTRKAEAPLGHMVYFKLKDSSPAAKDRLVAACKTYLSGHEGTIYFGAGTLAAELDREVNDRDWDVALHLVFTGKAAHDKYQDHPRHLKFIEENRENWAKVRVFDSMLVASEAVGTGGTSAKK